MVQFGGMWFCLVHDGAVWLCMVQNGAAAVLLSEVQCGTCQDYLLLRVKSCQCSANSPRASSLHCTLGTVTRDQKIIGHLTTQCEKLLEKWTHDMWQTGPGLENAIPKFQVPNSYSVGVKDNQRDLFLWFLGTPGSLQLMLSNRNIGGQ